MQQTLLIRLAKFVRLLVVGTIKSFRITLLASGLFLVLSMQARAQDDWKKVTTIDGVEISYQRIDCNNAEVLLIKAVNTKDQAVSLDLSYVIQVDETTSGKGDLGKITLDANAELVSGCEDDLSINVFEHFTEFNLNYSLQITKSE